MTEVATDEQMLAAQVYDAIQRASTYSERSQQSAGFQIGVSDLGFCSEKVRRMVAGIPEPVTDKLAAFLGTAIGDHVERACAAVWPQAIMQPAVSLTLHGDGGDYQVQGHPDLVLPEGVVIDFKTTRGLETVRRTGPSRQQQFQRHCYGLGAYEAGLFDEHVGVEDVRVANVWLDRAGDDHETYCHMESLSVELVEEAALWLDDVAYAYIHGEEARKEPPIEMCRKACGHYADCRAGEGDVGGLLTDDTVLAAVDLYRDGIDLEKQGRKLKDQARANLDGINGSTGKFSVRWVTVNGGEVHYTRDPYQKLDIRPVT